MELINHQATETGCSWVPSWTLPQTLLPSHRICLCLLLGLCSALSNQSNPFSCKVYKENALPQGICICLNVGSLCIKVNTLQVPQPSSMSVICWSSGATRIHTSYMNLLGVFQAIYDFCVASMKVTNKIKPLFHQHFPWTGRYLCVGRTGFALKCNITFRLVFFTYLEIIQREGHAEQWRSFKFSQIKKMQPYMLQQCNLDNVSQSFSSFIPSALVCIHHTDLNSCTVYSAQYITVKQLRQNQQIFLGAFHHYQTEMPLLIQVFWYNVSGKMMYQVFPTSWRAALKLGIIYSVLLP